METETRKPIPDSQFPTLQFNVPSTVIVGGGASAEVGRQAQRLGARRVLLVTDEGMVKLGVAAAVQKSLEEAGVDAEIFADVQPDPTDRNVLAGLERLRASGAQAIVAVGGGSSLDAAKVIGILTTNAQPMSQCMGYHKVAVAGAPVIAIPTTAGTGSEVTKVAVITDTARHVKMMMLDAFLLPRVALVDYRLTMTMPAGLTAAVGVDTLTHGIEAYVSRKANALTDPIALSCVGLVARNLRQAVAEPNHEEARAGMMLAACQGGMAFANASVCLVHGMSRPLGAVFHLAHGLSNAVLLPTVTRFSVASAPQRYAAVARAMGLAQGPQTDEAACGALLDGLEALNRELKIPRLGACPGVEREVFDANVSKMGADALASGSPQNNPRVPTVDEIVELYREAW